MEPIPLPHLACCSCSESGITYGVASNSSPSAGLIAVLDVRQGMLSASEEPELAQTKQTQVIQTTPPLAFDVHGAVASPNGRYLAVSGYDHQEEDQAVLVVVDIYGGQVQPMPHSVTKQRRVQQQQQQQQQQEQEQSPLLKVKQCMAHQVDYQLFASRKGLTVRQVAWHPFSEAHLVVLTSDNCLRLYHLSDLSIAEQTFHLKVHIPGAAGASGFGLSAAASTVDATAFSFGPATSWGFFTIYVLASSGAMYALCPVAPFGMPCPASALHAALADAEQAREEDNLTEDEEDESILEGGRGSGASGKAWLSMAFGSGLEAVAAADNSGSVAMPRFALPYASPALQGPLNAGAPSAALGADRAVSLCAMHQLSPDQGQSSPAGMGSMRMQVLTTLTSATARGTVFAHVLPGLLCAAWAGMPPATAVARGSSHLQSRSAGLYGRGGGGAWGGEVDEDVLVSLKMECECLGPEVPGGASSGGVTSNGVLLVDVVDLQSSLWGGQGAAEGEEDEEEEEEEEGGLVVVGGQGGGVNDGSSTRQHRRMSRVSATGGRPQRVVLLPLQQQAQLGGVPAATPGGASGPAVHAHELAVVSSQSCWVVQLPWVPVLARMLAGAGAQCGDEELAAVPSLLPRLPPPVVYELHNTHYGCNAHSPAGSSSAAAAPAVVAACVYHDFFVGQGVLVLQPQGSPALACLRPQAMPSASTPAGAEASDQQRESALAGDSAAAQATGGSARKGSGGASGEAAGVGAPRDDVVEAMIRAQYADLLAGAKAAAPPPGGYKKEGPAAGGGAGRAQQKDQQQQQQQQQGQGGATDAEFLHSVVRALRQGPIQYPHRAHQDVRTRAVQLDGEAQSHQAAVSELEHLCASLAERQQGLAERCAKAVRLQQNLEQRTALLTDIHWSVPRPLSIAEQQLQADLDVADLARKDTASKWAGLRKRTEHVLQAFSRPSHDLPASSPAAGALPLPSLPAPGTPPHAGAPPSPFSPWGMNPVAASPSAQGGAMASVTAGSGVPPPSLARTGEAAESPAGEGETTSARCIFERTIAAFERLVQGLLSSARRY
ncbi:hypothetical protein DUNSADRAFT_16002 [Dunaliella salina]|uniref:Uncharacterized protein n=1 Tax=Dunaliella salina TaxID=3046 RepID=A0ABQ7G4G4_DUNSA|nr:hypothetical protein DUNSADRAFT_16002 [Dunaliella salina]|eukprot:KAF5829493.1 hypothetical protein DUNSADRAFT_16002 [Dunaliella salina]